MAITYFRPVPVPSEEHLTRPLEDQAEFPLQAAATSVGLTQAALRRYMELGYIERTRTSTKTRPCFTKQSLESLREILIALDTYNAKNSEKGLKKLAAKLNVLGFLIEHDMHPVKELMRLYNICLNNKDPDRDYLPLAASIQKELLKYSYPTPKSMDLASMFEAMKPATVGEDETNNQIIIDMGSIQVDHGNQETPQ